MISTYKIVDKKIVVNTPYCSDVVEQCRKWAGKFEKGQGWVLPLSRLPDVQTMLGTDATDEVEVEVGQNDWKGYDQIRVGWFVLAGRRGRDVAADVYADLVAGEIPSSGGSVKNPAVKASEDARFRLWVPRDFATARNLTVTEDPKAGQEQKTESPLAGFSTEELLAELNRRGVAA